MVPTIIAVVVGIAVLFVVAICNKLVRLRNMVEEGWSGIDVQLKRRTNLVPNLLETVKGYMVHERELLARVTELRTQSLEEGDVAKKARLEGRLSGSLANVLTVAEREAAGNDYGESDGSGTWAVMTSKPE